MHHSVFRSAGEQAIRKLLREAITLAGVQAEMLKPKDLADTESDIEPVAVPEEARSAL